MYKKGIKLFLGFIVILLSSWFNILLSNSKLSNCENNMGILDKVSSSINMTIIDRISKNNKKKISLKVRILDKFDILFFFIF